MCKELYKMEELFFQQMSFIIDKENVVIAPGQGKYQHHYYMMTLVKN